MPTRETLERFIARVEQNAHVEAIAEFYAAEASMQENQSPPRIGRSNLIAHERGVLAKASAVESSCVRPVFLENDRVIIRWVFHFEWKDGTSTRLEELAYQQWSGDQILAETFFYDPSQLQRKPPTKGGIPTQVPPLTRSLGAAERSMRALLDRQLLGTGLSFPEWTALAISGTSSMSAAQVVQRQLDGHAVVDTAEANKAIAKLTSAGVFFINQSDALVHSERGAALFQSLSNEIGKITNTLYRDLPEGDLETTHRILMEITKRANELLAVPP